MTCLMLPPIKYGFATEISSITCMRPYEEGTNDTLLNFSIKPYHIQMCLFM